jgi:hypothetical protein
MDVHRNERTTRSALPSSLRCQQGRIATNVGRPSGTSP